jgi:carbonic anhydrase/acetyltransferase-like protein (isoleucine patch superfamily)
MRAVADADRLALRVDCRSRRRASRLTAYTSGMSLRPYLDAFPSLGERVYVDPAATVIGAVTLGDDVSIWPGCVVRGDVNSIVIGARTNVQDGTIVHVTHEGPFTRPGGLPTVIANDVTIGHGAIVHACTIDEFALIGMGAKILDGARVSRFGFVGAGAVIAPGKVVGEGELWVGNPARLARTLSEREIEQLQYSAQHYVRLKDRYLGMTPG